MTSAFFFFKPSYAKPSPPSQVTPRPSHAQVKSRVSLRGLSRASSAPAPAETTAPLGRGIMRSSTAERNDAHTELIRALAAVSVRAGLQWLPEVKELYGPPLNSPPGSTAGCERRMDLFIWQGAYRLLVDRTRIDGATDSYMRRALAVSQPLHGVEEAEKEKRKRYPDCPGTMEFKPVAVGVYRWQHY